ncbi:DUF480 domain-containing protein [Granulicella sp. 5B5]|uniref:YceH family protein n=1 Tax=Granulicella sp. 5B5 TaxID=1617967 RepID=UPI0015F6E904|nr:YceH family protein [Granulicella sp. 5B5]QMV18668.1 DUF480 domain-containing protein [Granulicella sp. 5B5]
MLELSLTEARVLGCLIEKEITTPEYYPLSLNATLNACNQKTNREPVMELTEADVRTAIFDLEGLGLVRTDASSRVSKFEHRIRDILNLRRDEVAVLCLLLLRGPQTPAEIRARAERLHAFDDNAAVTSTLERLSQRDEPLTLHLQRQPGARETRWMHLLSGTVAQEVAPLATAQRSSIAPNLLDQLAALEARVAALEARLDTLEPLTAPVASIE